MFQPKTIEVSWIDGNVEVELNMQAIIKLEGKFSTSLIEFGKSLGSSPKMSQIAEFYSLLLNLGGKNIDAEVVYFTLFQDEESLMAITENAAVALNCMFPDQEETGAPKGQTAKQKKYQKTTGKKSTA